MRSGALPRPKGETNGSGVLLFSEFFIFSSSLKQNLKIKTSDRLRYCRLCNSDLTLDKFVGDNLTCSACLDDARSALEEKRRAAEAKG